MNTGKKRENYGRGEHTIEGADYFAPDTVVATLQAAFESPKYQPPVLPAIALELMALTQQSEVSLTQVRNLLERDPVLAAQVLKVAHSGLYGAGRTFGSLTDAIALLGLQNVGDIFLQTALSAQVFRAKGFEAPMEAIRKHSTVTAHLARLVCRQTSLPEEYAFLCGLLHDVGMAAGLLILAGNAPRSTRRAKAPKPPAFEELAPSLQSVHQEAAELLAKTWKMPVDVQMVLRHHHHFKIGGRTHPLAAAVCIADWLSAEAGAGLGAEASPARGAEAANELQINKSALAKLKARAAELVDIV